MERKTAHDFDQDLLILFDAYVHGALDRRGFLDKAAKYAVGGVTAAMLLDQLSPKFLEAQQVRPDAGLMVSRRASHPVHRNTGGTTRPPTRATVRSSLPKATGRCTAKSCERFAKSSNSISRSSA